MSVLSGLSKADFKTASDGLLELPEERLRSLMRTEPITSVYHVEQTPFARWLWSMDLSFIRKVVGQMVTCVGIAGGRAPTAGCAISATPRRTWAFACRSRTIEPLIQQHSRWNAGF
ncbi:unnamed protein product [Spodoptera littoralis]|uniref:Uncharacterized protein n=1 Tax=Spodoptera littoralis TaxID=7109 RepID=A0A9P0IE10_SPOLI|nr:unnamed protein product [Spodoptera littoralis]CAH1645854.1 unnamed protein product [Spodoptera littoralis]